MKKGTRVYVEFEDITASLHDDKDLDTVIGQVMGWVISDTVRPPSTPVNAITPPDTTTDAYEWADGLEGVLLKEFYEGGYGL